MPDVALWAALQARLVIRRPRTAPQSGNRASAPGDLAIVVTLLRRSSPSWLVGGRRTGQSCAAASRVTLDQRGFSRMARALRLRQTATALGDDDGGRRGVQ